jgi:phytanoyl-CoA hydroxylase
MPDNATLRDDSWLAPDWRGLDLGAALTAWRRDGFAHLPGVVSPAGLAALRTRAEDLMHGRLDHTPFFFQGDAETGAYSDMPLGLGWVGPSDAYRKLEKLERDPLFLSFASNPLFERLARAVHPTGDIRLYRAILMNKRAGSPEAPGGTELPWHQDGGRLWGLDRDPTLQLWTALDDAPEAAGCMVFARGTHLDGLATPLGGAVPEAVSSSRPLDLVAVPARAGDVVLIHNLVWHASGRNRTPAPRRCFSVGLLDADTRCVRKKKAPRIFPTLFPATHIPHPFERHA